MKLIAFVSLDDPFWAGTVHDQPQKGPILTEIAKHSPDAVLLVHSAQTQNALTALLEELPHNLHIDQIELHSSADAELRTITMELESYSEVFADYTDASILESGTPQQRAALWVLHDKGALKGTMKSIPIEIPSVEKNFEQSSPKSLFRLREDAKDFEEEPAQSWSAVARKVGCIGKSARFTRTLEEAATLAGHSAPLLLIGETGSGKEVLSKFIHALSPRAGGPLVTVNCAALPEGLAESLLFGHEKGSFTGALRRQKGKFELANGGTLFLDEIGELTLANQAKLLRVLEDKKVDALGSDAPIAIDVRIIAATNRDLAQEVAKGNFREDLYYRLRAGEILIPPLRERAGDVPLIALHILAQFNMSLATPKQFSHEALKFLETQPWPGNVRDLMNTIERAALLSSHIILEPTDFKTDCARPKPATEGATAGRMPMLYQGFSLEKYISEMREALIDQALRQANGSQSEAARLLGLTPQAVSKYLKKNLVVARRG